ncbi:MAG: sigma-54-dependent Fis family transcriptional regulator [Cytophagales bacterium]|nr:sigma-54-dependent Fis family transcriptional regulator [Cytophaga sp.]
MKSILIIDDDTYICTLLEKFLKKKDFKVEVAYTGKTGLAKLKKDRFDLVLCDFRLPDIDGKQMLSEIKTLDATVQVIIITGYSDVRIAVQLIKAGAYEYVTKPIYPEEIVTIIRAALNVEAKADTPAAAIAAVHVSNETFENRFTGGDSDKFKEVMRHVALVAPTEMSVLIQGETGVGKEYIARAIHDQSKRKDKPFIAVDCGAIPKDIASSELFGHVKGAFTSAINNKEGFFETAEGGTLFLDEIGNLSYEIQVKLLRALQEKVISKVGDNKSIKVDVRIIAATNEELHNNIADATFREDLYHRVNEFMIHMPPLRERKDDIEAFATFFLKRSNQELQKSVKGFEEAAMNAFKKYHWYGNLRELKNVVKRSVLLSTTEHITLDVLPNEIKKFAVEEAAITETPGLKGASVEAEKEAILNALEQSQYNKSKAAELLNVDRKTLYNKIKQYNIEV